MYTTHRLGYYCIVLFHWRAWEHCAARAKTDLKKGRFVINHIFDVRRIFFLCPCLCFGPKIHRGELILKFTTLGKVKSDSIDKSDDGPTNTRPCIIYLNDVHKYKNTHAHTHAWHTHTYFRIQCRVRGRFNRGLCASIDTLQ